MKHLIRFDEWTKAEVEELLKLAFAMKERPYAYANALQGKKLYMLFEKTSTRTFLSFATGITELGGSYYCQNWKESNFNVGDVASETAYVSKTVDLIMMRLKRNKAMQTVASHASVPTINGCDNLFHPCQALADVMTIYEKYQRYDIKLLYVGIKNNVFNSLLEMIPLLGGTVYGFTPAQSASQLPKAFYEEKKKTGQYVELPLDTTPEQLSERIGDMDVVYTDTWVDMEYYNEPSYAAAKNEVIQQMLPYQINSKMLGSSKALVMHDMPIHTGYELSQETAEVHMEDILNQADNRRHTQKALMCKLLGVL